jgi:hypothetical protein
MQCTNKYTKKFRCIWKFSIWIHIVHARRKQWSISCLETLMAKIATIEPGWCMHTKVNLWSSDNTNASLGYLFYKINSSNPSRCHNISITFLEYVQYHREHLEKENTLQLAKITNIINATQVDRGSWMEKLTQLVSTKNKKRPICFFHCNISTT